MAKRRQDSPEFKAKVAVAALRGDRTLSELTSTFGVHRVQITKWTKQAVAGLPEVFGKQRCTGRQRWPRVHGEGASPSDEASTPVIRQKALTISTPRIVQTMGSTLNPLICPMIPFLDRASEFFEHPENHGYRIFHRTVEEHRLGMERASLINRINYETQWLSRADLVRVAFKAVRALMEAKAEVQALPRSIVSGYVAKIDDALEMIGTVHDADCISDPATRARELDKLGDEIVQRNRMIFHSGVINQAFPIDRQIGGRWFDELRWDPSVLGRASSQQP